MEKKLQDYRKSYQKGELTRKALHHDPLVQFKNWFEETEQNKWVEEVNAMTLSTLGKNGYPQSRVVLLKEFSEEGFIFYTNYNSQKGKAIEKHPKVSLSFFWPKAERQIIIQGDAKKVSKQKSDEYFYSRPKGSQIGAIVSNQSQIVESRQIIENKLVELNNLNENLKRPESWGGYLVKPISYEFWQGRTNRLHDRFRYHLEAGKWMIDRLSP
ncbi:pyridoxamine 5'-phosphate oxidase [Mesonia sp. K7]|uniref:pyridoxamine 5'-phosphate oxidase n=1 Tax=Mesonia sp. K7 TaxID=2218606 RepID=UPI000DA7C566|nr:pyridoxamine 5'-phosphate oxidase [Mesonia sp. K7]PZD79239.1 pyridoxamine 5'-phosphate oxidase [Mesonia sp. K7]